MAPQPATGPDGELYLLYLDLKEDRLDYEGLHRGSGGPPYGGRWELVLARSEDGGSTWSESVVEDRLVPAERFIAFIPPFPSLAIDPDGRLYAAFDALSGGDRDVLLWTLAPSAEDWQGPQRVNDTLERDETSQYLPKLATAPDGRLDILYYDRRVDPERDILTEGLAAVVPRPRKDLRPPGPAIRSLVLLSGGLWLRARPGRPGGPGSACCPTTLEHWRSGRIRGRARRSAESRICPQPPSPSTATAPGCPTRFVEPCVSVVSALVGVALLAPLAAPPALRLVRRGFRSRRRDSSA